MMRKESLSVFTKGCAGLLVSVCAWAQPNQEASKPDTAAASGSKTPTLEEIEQVRAMADLEFKKAIFWKPQNAIGTGLNDQAILLVEQVDPPNMKPPIGQFGAVVDNGGKVAVNENEPTIYYGWAQTPIGSETYKQLTFLWFYPNRTPDSRWPLAWRAVRITHDKEGGLFTAEALEDRDRWIRYFVNKGLEEYTSTFFQTRKPGRKFHLERPVDEAPKSMLVRLLDKGPVPTGPYVYLTWPDRDISTLLCRCSPSQAEEFVEDRTYMLRPFQALPESMKLLWEGLLTGKGLGGSTVPDLRLPMVLIDLERTLQKQYQQEVVIEREDAPQPQSTP